MKNREPAFPRRKEERCDHCWAVIGDERVVTKKGEGYAPGVYCSDGCADEAEDSVRSQIEDERESGRASAEEYGR